MIYPSSPENINSLAERLRQEEIVALPTETVYGLAGLATSNKAIASIYAQKNRPQFNPLIIHGSDIQLLKTHVTWNERAEKLATAFWPGPLTLVLSKKEGSPLSLLALAGLDTVALRMPNHPVMKAVLDQVGLLAAPSANPSGAISPTSAQDVEKAFQGSLPVLEGGLCQVGLESTILDVTGTVPTLLRPGGITIEEIENVVGRIKISHSSKITAPGQLESHYAPSIPLRINAEERAESEAFLTFGPRHPETGADLLNLSPQGDLKEAASNLFSMLRTLDQKCHSGIAVSPIPEEGLGVAINDRLRRASAPRSSPGSIDEPRTEVQSK